MLKTLFLKITPALAISVVSVFLQVPLSADEATDDHQILHSSPEDLKVELDDEITNPRMRAESGSRSRFSMSTSLGYTGGTIKRPLSNRRPNIYGNPEVETRTNLSGSVAARYRLGPRDSLSFGTGIGVLTPLSSERDTQVSNPYLGYSRYYRLGPLQNSSSIHLTQATSDSWRRANLERRLSLSHKFMSQLGQSQLSAGLTIEYTKFFYSDRSVPDDRRASYALALYPQLEYRFNDRFSFRTVLGLFNYRKYRGNDTFDLDRVYEYQSVGLGISITRDIYLYPNVQFLIDDLDIDKTNMALSATINLF